MADREEILANFIAITDATTPAATNTARNILEATDYKLEDAMDLWMATAGGEQAESQGASMLPELNRVNLPSGPLQGVMGGATSRPNTFDPLMGEDDVRAPIPVRRDQLYDAAYHLGDGNRSLRFGQQQNAHNIDAFRDFRSEEARRGANDSSPSDRAAPSPAASSGSGLADLFKPPQDLLFQGTFEAAKQTAAAQNRWLLANVQSNAQFASHQLNRDTWSHATVKDIVQGCFIFWQVADSSDQGGKIMTFYRLDELPAVMVIDPVTGAKMKDWKGFVEPDRMLEGLMPFLERQVSEAAPLHKRNRSASKQSPAPDARKTSRPEASPMTEDEELAAALAASAAEAASGPNESPGRPGSASATPPTAPQNAQSPRPKPPVWLPSLNRVPLKGPANPAPASASAAAPSSEVFVPKVRAELEEAVPAEPLDNDSSTVRVAVRTPVSRIQRRFPGSATVKALYSFCTLQVDEALQGRPFVLASSGPGGKELKDQDVSLAHAEVHNSMLSMRWTN
ncbi:hypothetical protein WJX73_000517 [Symbiochloris irregularis]|uniref:UAS domain-containing protein n=1 Tax=Symbiochloris irregularis TaxID=706552 RepID=A0AAW1P1W9_9CHLO